MSTGSALMRHRQAVDGVAVLPDLGTPNHHDDAVGSGGMPSVRPNVVVVGHRILEVGRAGLTKSTVRICAERSHHLWTPCMVVDMKFVGIRSSSVGSRFLKVSTLVYLSCRLPLTLQGVIGTQIHESYEVVVGAHNDIGCVCVPPKTHR